MIDRIAWNNLALCNINNTEMVTSRHAAEYLGMHVEAFRQLARDNNLQPDLRIGRTGLYTRATLDSLDKRRRRVGRPRNA